MKKTKIVLLITLISLIFCIGCKKEEKKVEIKQDDQAVASMYYSYMLGMDAGKEYTIVIYKNKNTYKYEILKSEITITGSGETKEERTGLIKTREDLKNIDKEFQEKKEMNVELTYSYYHDLTDEKSKVESIDKLADILFK